jgi:putative ABC transport system permease protein
MVIGTAAAYGMTLAMASLLFQLVKPDAFTFAGCVLAIGVTALLASYLPVRRAARVDPLIALREN